MLGADGRVVVLDFGLAAPDAGTPTEETEEDLEDAPLERLTATRAVVGTPAYMAPEQHRGEPATAKSDQFSFCVSLFEALYGVRPFPGATRASVLTAIEAGEIVSDVPIGSGVAPRIRRVLRRGLSAKPGDRYPSIEALLVDLDLRRVARRRVLILGAMGGVAALGAAYAFGTQQSEPVTAEVTCATPEAVRAELWDEPYRGRVEAAYAADERPHVQSMAGSVLADMDAWASKWAQARAGACRATRELGEQSEALLQLRLRCYDAAAARLRGLADTLIESDMDRPAAPALLPTLPALKLCKDTEWLERNSQLPGGEDGPARLAALDHSAVAAHLSYRAGRLKEARGMFEAALQEARVLQHEPSEAHALFGLARIDHVEGNVEQAELGLTEAMTKYIASGDEYSAAETAVELMDYAGQATNNPAERRRWTKVAEGLITKAGSPTELQARLELSLSVVLSLEGDHQTALEHARRGLELYEQVYGEVHPEVARAHEQVGGLLQESGRADEGLPHVERSLAIESQLWGPDHPRVAQSRVNLAIVYGSLGRAEDAARELETALAATEAIYGPDSFELSKVLVNLGEARMMQDRPEDTLALNDRALRLNEEAYGPEHPEVAYNLSNGAGALVRLERYAEAETRLRRALAIRHKTLGPDHPLVGITQFNLGAALSGKGDHPGAVEALTEAERIWRTSLGAEHPNTAAAQVNLGEARIAAGQRNEGLAQMRAGVQDMIAALGEDHPDVADARAQLAAAGG